MDLLQKRNNDKDAILKGRYIQEVLRDEGKNLDEAIKTAMSSFSNSTRSGRQITVNENTLSYQHKARHRFIDIKTRGGKKKKKSYKIHNRPIYGILSNIISRLSYGYTEAARNQMHKLMEQKEL